MIGGARGAAGLPVESESPPSGAEKLATRSVAAGRGAGTAPEGTPWSWVVAHAVHDGVSASEGPPS